MSSNTSLVSHLSHRSSQQECSTVCCSNTPGLCCIVKCHMHNVGEYGRHQVHLPARQELFLFLCLGLRKNDMLEEQVFAMLAGLFLYFGRSQVGWFPPDLSLFTEVSLA